MIISSLSLKNFRNHTDTDCEWGNRLNIITGVNGAGKTNLIDAIHYLCMSRSFVSSTDQYVLQSGQKEFEVSGRFKGSIRNDFSVTCAYSRGDGKKIFVNDSPLDKLSDLIGMVPVVVLSPDDKKLTSEGPAERRSFLDSFISQLSKSYLKDLIDYRRVLKQRNVLLSKSSGSSSLSALLEPWNEQLIEIGSRITLKRSETLQTFSDYLHKGYETIAGIGHRPHLVYKGLAESPHNINDIKSEFRTQLENDFNREKDRELTLTGPHRDDIVFYLNDMELRKFGSQGQHRLFALALKIAQRNYFEDMLDDLPIFLLDDVFGDLDPYKTNILVDMLKHQNGQTFITSANKNLFIDFVSTEPDEIHYYEVKDGLVTLTL